jgi:hypothetical protein
MSHIEHLIKPRLYLSINNNRERTMCDFMDEIVDLLVAHQSQVIRDIKYPIPDGVPILDVFIDLMPPDIALMLREYKRQGRLYQYLQAMAGTSKWALVPAKKYFRLPNKKPSDPVSYTGFNVLFNLEMGIPVLSASGFSGLKNLAFNQDSEYYAPLRNMVMQQINLMFAVQQDTIKYFNWLIKHCHDVPTLRTAIDPLVNAYNAAQATTRWNRFKQFTDVEPNGDKHGITDQEFVALEQRVKERVARGVLLSKESYTPIQIRL